MPQIDQIATIYASQLFWLVVVFALIYFGIGRAMLPKIQGAVDSREARIARDIADAESARAEAARADEAYQAMLTRSRADAQAAAAKAQAEATHATEARVKAADAVSHQHIQEAEQALQTRAAQAAGEIDAAAAELVQEIVSKVAGFSVDRDAAAQAVRAAVTA